MMIHMFRSKARQGILLFTLITCSLLSACTDEIKEKEYLPSEHYHLTEKVFSELTFQQEVYVPIYSDIYIYSGDKTFPLTATLSVRNTSRTDTVFVESVDYYDSIGNLTKEYLSDPIFIKPLETVEFVVRSRENQGGVGANFMVKWGAGSDRMNPVIQAVMIGDSNQQGISFVTEGVVVE